MNNPRTNFYIEAVAVGCLRTLHAYEQQHEGNHVLQDCSVHIDIFFMLQKY